MNTPISVILRHRNNWVKGDEQSTDGKRVCLAQAAIESKLTKEEMKILAVTVRELFPERQLRWCQDPDDVIVRFNDHDDTRFDHVKKVIDEFERRIAD